MIDFVKYHGTGNDFILIDARHSGFPHDKFTQENVKMLCHRRFGIGADGLVLMKRAEGFDFHMDYFNADGRRSSMCGNGSRCAMHFAKRLGMIEEGAHFLAPDGSHEGHFVGELISVKMNAAKPLQLQDGNWEVETGSPHYVQLVDDVAGVDVFKEGEKIRYSKKYKEIGINVNFLEEYDKGIKVSTYERGVEDETLSCGTGVTACALVHLTLSKTHGGRVEVETKGGFLSVEIGELGVWLIGPVVRVYEGKVSLD